MKNHWVLVYLGQYGESRAKVVQAKVSYGYSIDDDTSARSFDQPEQRHRERRFTCSCPTHNSHLVERDVENTINEWSDSRK